MAASTNATTVLWGTAWTSKTLLAKTERALHRLEGDGFQRVFQVPWERAVQENPPYAEYVRGEIQRLGRDHPLIKTQYFPGVDGVNLHHSPGDKLPVFDTD